SPALESVIALYRERIHTLNELADEIAYFYRKPVMDQAAKEKHLTPEILPVLKELAKALSETDWSAETIHTVINSAVQAHALKFPKVAMPLRVLITGGAQSPSIDVVMELLGQAEVLARINEGI
ncbi:MAG: glutamate--tRNA ligase, partial [Nitrosomonadales bacterium]|nr:glutamate--tRNA ligase [Nitrosomonadales bacterium]